MRLRVFIDGWCPNCSRFSRIVKKLDILHRIEILDIRLDSHPKLDHSKALKAMASIDSTDNVYYGFKTMYSIVSHLPVLWILLPFLALLNVFNLGDFLYNEFAIRRKIIPIHCDELSCNLN